MPAREGQLDQISQSIGRLEGRFEAVEQYMHDREHGLNNLSQKLDALGTKITGDIAAVEERVRVRIEQVETRLISLENARHEDIGARRLTVWFIQSPLFAWIAAAAVLAWAWLKNQR